MKIIKNLSISFIIFISVISLQSFSVRKKVDKNYVLLKKINKKYKIKMFEEEFDLMLRHLISDFLLSDIKKDIIINRITNQIVKLTSNSENIKDFKKKN